MANRKKISKEERLRIYEKYNGHCAYCGCEITYSEMQADHIVAKYKGELKNTDTDFIENYVPACRMCNFYKSTFDIETFRKRIMEVLLKNLQKSFAYRMAIKYNLIHEDKNEIIFYFEKIDS